MIPSAFAIFPDPEEDPRHYLVRYYTEPSYQAWFDKNYPNDTIEDKVGYSKKIVTDDYYVDQLFDFVVKYPSMPYVVDEKAQSMVESVAGLVTFYFGGTPDAASVLLFYYNQDNIEDIYYDDLLYYYSEYPEGAIGAGVNEDETISTQMKVTNETWDNDGTRDIIRYELSLSTYFTNNYWNEEARDTTDLTKVTIVILLYPNGDRFSLLLNSPVETYSEDVKEFDKIVDSFYVGETEKLSDLLEDYAPELKSAAAEPSGGCGEGTVLVNGVCQLAPEVKAEQAQTSGGCGQGTVLVDGVCQVDESSGTSIPPLYLAGGAAAIAAAVIGVVFAYSRNSKTPKTTKQNLEEYEEQYLAEQNVEPSPKPAEKEETSAFCTGCGASLKPEAMFCGKCGVARS